MNSDLNSAKNVHRNLYKTSNGTVEEDDVIINNLSKHKIKSFSKNSNKINDTIGKPINQPFSKGTRSLKPKKEVKFNLDSTINLEKNPLSSQQII